MKDGQVLLGEKKRGEIGTGTLNGPGGKREGSESLVECAVRETKEELNLELKAEDLEKVAVIVFFFKSTPDFEVHVYRTKCFAGEPKETNDMIPAWYSVSNLPYERMLESDRVWVKRALVGEPFRANVYYEDRASKFKSIEFLDS